MCGGWGLRGCKMPGVRESYGWNSQIEQTLKRRNFPVTARQIIV